jgi:hypothetical protein
MVGVCRKLLRILPILGLIAALALTSGVAAAGKGKGSGGGGKGGNDATLTFSASTVSVGDSYVVTGDGFGANAWVTVGARYPIVTIWYSTVTDSQGQFSLVMTADEVGELDHDAYEEGGGRKLRLKASGTISILER